MDQAFCLVLGFDQIATFLVGLGIVFGVLHHLVDLILGQAARSLDRDLVLLAGAFVLGAHSNDAVGVDVEGHLNLRQTTRCGRDIFQVELGQHLVVVRHLALTLEDPDRHGVLVVFRGREDLRLLGRDRGVAVDQPGENTTQRFNAKAQRCDVQQHHVLDVALKNTGLNGGTQRYDFVRVHTFVRLLAEELRSLLQ